MLKTTTRSFGNWLVGYPDRARLWFCRIVASILLLIPGLASRIVTAQMSGQEADRLMRLEQTVYETRSEQIINLAASVRANTQLIDRAQEEQRLRNELLQNELERRGLVYTLSVGGTLFTALAVALWRLALHVIRKVDEELTRVSRAHI